MIIFLLFYNSVFYTAIMINKMSFQIKKPCILDLSSNKTWQTFALRHTRGSQNTSCIMGSCVNANIFCQHDTNPQGWIINCLSNYHKKYNNLHINNDKLSNESFMMNLGQLLFLLSPFCSTATWAHSLAHVVTKWQKGENACECLKSFI